ncbi:unconventional myosin-IXa isoform X1 [Hydra vulgaris]|uniref:unconventional myosin-IXa isoform X1 n=1 Tax=Hydra vulgaris TaxID=6087 RepID=UPI0006415277|nr:unconventional myosin-IXa isoform X1 [Hydra vulgaris]
MFINKDENEVQLFPIKIYLLKADDSNESTTVNVKDDATVSDVIESALENFSIVLSAEDFQLCEIFNESGVFPNDLDTVIEKGRILLYSEYPVKTVQDWGKNILENEKLFFKTSKEVVEAYRICLIPKKTESCLEVTDIKVRWLDGLNSKLLPEEWHFDPYFRDEIEDLVNLPILNEKVILEELCKRFCLGRIYTYIGGILIAINPFKYFPIYNPKYVKAYQHKKLGELPPHVFAIADCAYDNMLKDRHDQCIVISGESGSGKTESTKLILHHLTALSHKTKATLLERTILAAGPVLEAFGNAKTCHNNNSSRFGKFTQINYRADGVVCGAVQKKYLLEKSRIVSQAVNERNYHVFYYLLAGASEQEKEILSLQNAQSYHYLNQTSCYQIENVDEKYEFARLKHAIKNLGISSKTQLRMFSVLSAVLHIGNIRFKKLGLNEEAVCVEDDSLIDTISKLLQVEKQDLVQALTLRKTITRGEEYIRFYRLEEAAATRDAMAKCLYASLFDWIVLQTNHILLNRQGKKNDQKAFSIGVLDIFGFEDFEHNSFEQFCINLANENLQHYLTQHIFKIRQDEYTTEGLMWDHVDYVDNLTCLNLIVKKPTGLIHLLDEECSLTIGTDKSLLDKFNKHHGGNPFYEMPPTREPVFSIIHYAGTVKYKIKHFRAKNQDLIRSDITTTFKNSRMLFMRELMGSDPVACFYWAVLRHIFKVVFFLRRCTELRSQGKGSKNSDFKQKTGNSITDMTPPNRRKFLLKKMSEAAPEYESDNLIRQANKVMNRRVFSMAKNYQNPSKVRSALEVKRTISGGMTETLRRGSSKAPPTVVAQFQSSLQELMDTLNQSHPLFVRCVRSNAKKAPLEFDAELILRQLRYTGMLETVKIRQAGYSVRLPFEDFVKQFKVLFPANISTSSSSGELTILLVKLGLNPGDFQIGATKVFMRENQYQLMRFLLQKKCDDSATKIQKWYLACYQRRLFLQMVKAVIEIQKIWRGYQGRKFYNEYKLRNMAALHIVEFWKYHKIKRQTGTYFMQYKKAVVTIQSAWRGYSARKKIKILKLEDKEHREIVNLFVSSPKQPPLEAVTQETVTKEPVLHKNSDGVPYSSHRSRQQEKSESLLKEAFKDTIFNEQTTNDSDDQEKYDTNTPEITFEPNHIGHFDSVNKPEIIQHLQTSKTKSTPVKMRHDNRLRVDDLHDHNFKQKILRRLSFSAKDKLKVTPKIVKEDGDNDFEIITVPVLDLLEHTKKGTTPNTPKTTFGVFLSNLQRRGSKRDSLAKEKNRRSVHLENVINGQLELEAFNEFLMSKVTAMNRADNTKSNSEADTLFKNGLHIYHGKLLLTYANAVQSNKEFSLNDHDLVFGFQLALESIQDMKVSKEFSVMGRNLFQGIIEEFVKQKEKLLLKKKHRKPIKRNRRKTSEYIDHNGHLYSWQSFNIQTYCEFCNSFIYERGLLCQACSFTCHKKCYIKYSKTCKGRRPSVCGPSSLFGTDLSEITSNNNPIPEAILKLIEEIEKRGLYVEGLYRKPGPQAAINNLKSVLTSKDAEDLIFEDEKPHTLASLLKLFFRQLPKPVVCEDFYEDFLRSTDLKKAKDTQATLYELIQRFPKANKELLERVIIHLSRVAMYEDTNKMSPNALAIIWAPCLMRPPSDTDPLETIQQLSKQTKCIEILIQVQVTTRRDMVEDISVLDRAASSVERRLEEIKENQMNDESIDGRMQINNEELQMLELEISSMDAERRRLTNNLSTMEPSKSQSLNSLDELSDFEVLGESSEDISSVSSNQKKTNNMLRFKFISGVDYDSSFDDVFSTNKRNSYSDKDYKRGISDTRSSESDNNKGLSSSINELKRPSYKKKTSIKNKKNFFTKAGEDDFVFEND